MRELIKRENEKKPIENWEDSEPIVKKPLPPKLQSDTEKFDKFWNGLSFVLFSII